MVRLGTFDQFDGAECTKTLYTGYQVVRIAQLVHRCCADFRAPSRSGGVEGYLRRRREAGLTWGDTLQVRRL